MTDDEYEAMSLPEQTLDGRSRPQAVDAKALRVMIASAPLDVRRCCWSLALLIAASSCGSDSGTSPAGNSAMSSSSSNTPVSSSSSDSTVSSSSTSGTSGTSGTNAATSAGATGSATIGAGGASTSATQTNGAGMSSTGGASTTTATMTNTATTGSAGSGGGTSLTGGASAAFVCPADGNYGDPLAGMGAVQEIAAPQSSYFAFIEGPVWVGSLNTLFFSDNASSPDERIWKLVPPSTTPEIYLEPSGSNGLAIDGNDQLILADQRGKQITRVNSSGFVEIETLAGPGAYTPNDVIVRSDGNIYFTDPASGFYRVSPSGEVSEPNNGVAQPNGAVLSLDENTLYVGDVGNRQIHAFAIDSDGAIGSGSLFVTATNNTVDGMALDCAGNLYAGTANGVEVFSPEGAALGTVPTGESSNATFGGSDRRTLYVTSRAVLKYVTLAVPGLPD